MTEVLVVFGEGGHAAQMRRLLEVTGLSPTQCIAIVDRDGLSSTVAEAEWVVPPLREKYGLRLASLLARAFVLVGASYQVLRRYRPSAMLSTGPGLCLAPALLCRISGLPVIHIETWSRFRTRSLSGRVMYHLATHFYVQNTQLLQLYPKARYSGRL